MRLTAVLLSALAFCLVGFVFAVYDYARHGATAPAARVTPVLQPSAPPAGFNPVPSSTPLAPPEPAAVPSPEVQAPAAPAAAAGPIALAPQPVEAQPIPAGAVAAPIAVPAAQPAPPPDSRPKNDHVPGHGHGDGGGGGGGGD